MKFIIGCHIQHIIDHNQNPNLFSAIKLNQAI